MNGYLVFWEQSLEEKQFQKVESSFSPKKESTAICRVCQSSLEDGDAFCPECGSAVAPSVSICRVCSTENSGDVCGKCGTPVKQILCQHCEKEAEGDFCGSCGKAITDLGREFIENVNQAVEPKIIQIDGSQQLKSSLLSELGEDFLEREERRIEKIILLRERQFFQEREKRVEEFFKSGIVHFQRIEDKEILKIRERIEKSSGYLSRQLKEKEEREAEERRIAEEKKREETRKERWNNRINGIYVAQNYSGTFVIKIQDGVHGKMGDGMEKDRYGNTLFNLDIKWNGEKISFFTYDIKVLKIRKGWEVCQLKFVGRASDDGEILRGYCYSAETWEEIFIKE